MRVKIGPYKNWIGPYQIAEIILFWIPKYDKTRFEYTKSYDKYVYGFGKWLAGGKDQDSTLMKICEWINSKRKRTIKIQIDPWDTWSMDNTLACIILPMLKQLKNTKHGSPIVDLEDVPEDMRTIDHEEYDGQYCFEFYHESDLQKIQCDLHNRWEWILDEMIFAFEHIVDDSWKDKYRSGKIDYLSVPYSYDENNKPITYSFEKGPNHTYNCDYDGMMEVETRIKNGLQLFGKYYQGLWD